MAAVPEDLFFGIGQIVISAVDWEIDFVGIVYEFSPPFTHLFASPALHTLFLYREALVGNYQVFINPHHLPKSFTLGTSSGWTVEVEHHLSRLFEGDIVCLKTIGEDV